MLVFVRLYNSLTTCLLQADKYKTCCWTKWKICPYIQQILNY